VQFKYTLENVRGNISELMRNGSVTFFPAVFLVHISLSSVIPFLSLAAHVRSGFHVYVCVANIFPDLSTSHSDFENVFVYLIHSPCTAIFLFNIFLTPAIA
jgi:hypothetical protein